MKNLHRKSIALTIALALTFSPVSVIHADTAFDTDFPQVSNATASNAPISGSCDTEDAAISISVTDGTTTVDAVETTCTGEQWNAAIDVSTLEDGTITAAVSISGELSEEVNTQKDITPPDISVYVGDGEFSLITLADGYVFDTADPLFEFNQNDGDGISILTCVIDGGAPEDCLSFSYQPTGLSDGPHTLVLDITSDIGNTGATTTNFCVNTCDEGEEEVGFDIVDSVALPNGCSVTDTSSTVHYFPTATTSEYLAICALVEAVDAEIIDGFTATEFSGFGLFVDSINGISEEGAFWSLSINATSSEVGVAQLALEPDDEIVMELTTFDGDPLPYRLTLTIDTLVHQYNNIILPDACEVTDTSEVLHQFSDEYLAICAVVEGVAEGYIDSFDAVDFGFGLYIENFNDAVIPENTYWQFFVNTSSSPSGVAATTLAIGDEISFLVSDFSDELVEFCECVNVRVIGLIDITVEEEEETPPPEGGGGGSGGGGIVHGIFNVPAALAYLSSKQSADGSFGASLFTDWAALAFAAADPGTAKVKLVSHMQTASPTLSGVQDYIRHSMALMALGIDPYVGTNVNYIAPIVSSFDGTQIGDPSLDNDDIFALFPLTHAGYSGTDEIVSKSVAFIVSRQLANGSWTGGVDVTAAAVQALAPQSALPGVSAALTKAEAFLRSQQQSNGGFGSSFSTSWTMQAIAAFGQQQSSWTQSGYHPHDYLASMQQSDGGVELVTANDQTRIWATEYAIPAAVGKTWNELLTSFSKPPIVGGGGTVLGTSTSPTLSATSSDPIASSTSPFIATSTPPEASNETNTVIIQENPPATPPSTPQVFVENPVNNTLVPIEEVLDSETLNQVANAATADDGTINWLLVLLLLIGILLLLFGSFSLFLRTNWD